MPPPAQEPKHPVPTCLRRIPAPLPTIAFGLGKKRKVFRPPGPIPTPGGSLQGGRLPTRNCHTMNHLAPKIASLATAILLALAGCRNQHVALRELQRENFLLGEQLTQMEILLADYESALRRCRSKLQRSQERESPQQNGEEIPPFKPPEVDLGTPQADHPPDSAPRLTAPAGRTARTRRPRPRVARSTGRYAAEQVNSGRMIARLELAPEETQAVDTDGDEVADLIQVVLVARDALGRPVPPAGELAVAVVDHHFSAPRRLARWDYSAEALRLHVVQDHRRRPLALLRLKWEGPLPQHEKLRVYVRLLPGDGRSLQAQREITFQLGKGSGPAPRPSRRPRPPAADSAPRYGRQAESDSPWAPAGTFSWRGGSRSRHSSPAEPAELASPRRTPHTAAPQNYRRSVQRPRWRPYR